VFLDTVFVLGAGFSAPAKMPVQAEIMSNIVSRESQSRTRKTMRTLFNAVTAQQMIDVPLDDVFTILDRARERRETLVGFTQQQLEDSYKTLIRAIVAEFDRRLDAFEPAPYTRFIAELTRAQLVSTKNQRRSRFVVTNFLFERNLLAFL
jgi:predicted transcriptional regulator